MNKKVNIVFISSSFINLAFLFAQKNPNFDVFLILDKKFPSSFEEESLENFYSFTFDKNKIFEKNKEKYFDSLSIFIEQFEPDIIVSSNFHKLIPNSFINFLKFRNSKIKIINIHHADLRVIEDKEIKFKGLNGMEKQFLSDLQFLSTLHFIEDEKMDEGEQISYSHETNLKELKQKNLLNKKEDILNLRLKNMVIAYHERNKVLNLLSKEIENLIK